MAVSRNLRLDQGPRKRKKIECNRGYGGFNTLTVF